MKVMERRACMRGAVAAGACLVLALPLAASAQVPGPVGGEGSRSATAGSPIPVKASPILREMGPAADGSWLVWSHDSRQHPGLYYMNAFAQLGTRTPVRLNERGIGFTGGVDGYMASYSQRVGAGKTYLYTYNLRTGVRHRLPYAVNGDIARDSTISGRWLFFYRWTSSDETASLILYDRFTHASKRLAYGRAMSSIGLAAGQVNGRWVVWYKSYYRAASGYVMRYNTRTQHKQLITRDGVDPAVSSDGTVYFMRGQTLVRVSPGGTETVIAQMPGYSGDLFVKDRSLGGHAIYFVTSAGRRDADVYKIIDR